MQARRSVHWRGHRGSVSAFLVSSIEIGACPSPPKSLPSRLVSYIRFSLLGVTLSQMCSYLTHHWHSDGPRLKALVIAVTILDTVHQGLISHTSEFEVFSITARGTARGLDGRAPAHLLMFLRTVYTYVISNYANPAILGQTVWSLLLEVIFNGCTALLVQG